MTRKTLGLRGVALATMAITALPLAAEAQMVALEEIVVTARKRTESLQDIPLAITAFTSAQLDAQGLTNLVDIAKFSPGLNFEEQGVQEPGRVYTAVRFRGLGSEIKEPFGQTGSAFLDGIYMSNGVSSLGSELFERVEVVKGPSSAWLGRSTFAGAVNFITKTPSTDEYEGRVTAKYAEDQSYDISVSHSGPIVEDRLAYRVYVRGYGTGGQFTAGDGGALGKESTDTLMGTLYATPSDNLTVKLNALFASDEDGAPAQAMISGPLGLRGMNTSNVTNCFSQGITSPTILRPNGAPLTDWVCGPIPERLDLIDSNTVVDPEWITFWNEIVPEVPGIPFLDHVGLKRDQLRLSGEANYDIDGDGFFGGSTATLLVGYAEEDLAFIRDFDVSPVQNWLSRDPSSNDWWQLEARITSDQDRALTWSLGVSYFDASFKATYQGGEVIVGGDGGLTVPFASFDLDSAFGRASDGLCPCFFPPLQTGPTTFNETLGVFGSLNFDFTDEIGLDFEWRWQRDEITVQAAAGDFDVSALPTDFQAFDVGGGRLGDTNKTFLPRITLQYQPTDETNVWFTFSRGNTPGFFNGDLINRPIADVLLVAAARPDSPLFVEEEKLDNFELGWKQQFMDNRINFSLVAYYMEWKNQKTRTGETITRPDSTQIAANLTVGGFDTEFKGIEFEGSFAATENLTFDTGIAFADAEFQVFSCGFTDDFAPPAPDGTLDCSGNRPVQSPKWTGALAGTWTDALTDDWDYFLRWDAAYTGKRFVDEQNFAWVDSRIISNLRVGVANEDFRLEAFVTNLFNDKTWSVGQRWSDFSADQGGLFPFEFTAQQGIALTGPDLRQFGVRASYNF